MCGTMQNPLTDIRSSNNHPLNPGYHYLLKALNVGLHVENEELWEDACWDKLAATDHHTKNLLNHDSADTSFSNAHHILYINKLKSSSEI